jgi:hypothetical protein
MREGVLVPRLMQSVWLDLGYLTLLDNNFSRLRDMVYMNK